MTVQERDIALYTHEGVRDADITVVPFTTPDKLGLSMVRFQRGEADEAVLVVHGLTTSTDMFIMPEHENLVTYLLDNGYRDVWCLDFRMSNRHSYNLFRHRFTLDDVALFDFPAAIDVMRTHIGERPIHAITHCLGAAAFVMSVFGKVIDEQVTSVVANSAGLTLRVPKWSRMKLATAPAVIDTVLRLGYLNPRWSEDPGLTGGELFSRLTSALHTECDVPACHMLSMMWGTGWPALYEHDNLADVTHRRGGDLYGPTSMHYYRHVRKIVKAQKAVKYDPDDATYDALPDNYFRYAREVDTPVLWMTGESNRVFTDSNIVCHEWMQKVAPGRDELAVFPGYGHQDPFMGKDVARDIFPRLKTFLDTHRDGAQRPGTARPAVYATG